MGWANGFPIHQVNILYILSHDTFLAIVLCSYYVTINLKFEKVSQPSTIISQKKIVKILKNIHIACLLLQSHMSIFIYFEISVFSDSKFIYYIFNLWNNFNKLLEIFVFAKTSKRLRKYI